MEPSVIVLFIVLFLVAGGCIMIGVFQFREKGPLLNNAYLFASAEERERMDKKPHYRQSGMVFCLLGIVFLIAAVEVLLKTGWLYYVAFAVILLMIIYAIVSSVRS